MSRRPRSSVDNRSTSVWAGNRLVIQYRPRDELLRRTGPEDGPHSAGGVHFCALPSLGRAETLMGGEPGVDWPDVSSYAVNRFETQLHIVKLSRGQEQRRASAIEYTLEAVMDQREIFEVLSGKLRSGSITRRQFAQG